MSSGVLASTFFLLYNFFLGVVMTADMRPDAVCPGAYRNGELFERGQYWYQCLDGRHEPRGCLTDKKVRIQLYESYQSKGYSYQCILDERGDVEFRYKGCVSEKNVEYAPDETWQDDGYWYMCIKVGDHLEMDVGGCVYEGQRYNIGQYRKKGDFQYGCFQMNGSTGWRTY